MRIIPLPTVPVTFAGMLRHGVSVIRVWARRRRTRKELKELDTRLLSDVGITSDDQAIECGKPFWK